MPDPDPTFLDALIGDLRQEAARRRAAPLFPVDEEVRLGQELDAQAPAPRDRSGRVQPDRLEELERRLDRLERETTVRVAAAPMALDAVALAAGTPGRVLYWGADPAPAVAALRAAGVDAYGIDPAGDRYQLGPDVRHADLIEHLAAVADQALALVIVAGIEAAPGPQLAGLAAELARAAQRVAVASEAPWYWKGRIGLPGADLSTRRPVEAETWLALLGAAGRAVRAEYPVGGSTYVVWAE